MIPDAAMHPTRAAVLAALLTIFDADGRVTIRGICDDVGISTSTCHHHLLALRRAGLVGWEPQRAGTLHPRVAARAVA